MSWTLEWSTAWYAMWCVVSFERLPHRMKWSKRIITYREEMERSLSLSSDGTCWERDRWRYVCAWRLYNLKIPPKTMLLLISLHGEKKRNEEKEQKTMRELKKRNLWIRTHEHSSSPRRFFLRFFVESWKNIRLTETHQECANAVFVYVFARILFPFFYLHVCFSTFYRMIEATWNVECSIRAPPLVLRCFGNHRLPLPWKIFFSFFNQFLLFFYFNHFISFHHQ
jgi:hypothetical protein